MIDNDLLQRILIAIRSWETSMSKKLSSRVSLMKNSSSCSTCTEPGCCLQKIPVPMFEGIVIADLLKREGRDTPELRNSLRLAMEEMEQTANGEYFHKKIPCVFLKNKKCSIYEVRPTSCRTYYVESDPTYCQPETEAIVDILNVDDYLESSMKFGISFHHHLGIKEGPDKIFTRSLPGAVLIGLEYLDNPKDNPTNNYDWPSIHELPSWIEDGGFLYQIRANPDKNK